MGHEVSLDKQSGTIKLVDGQTRLQAREKNGVYDIQLLPPCMMICSHSFRAKAAACAGLAGGP
eukprot:8540291-Pyramimonas_sp.AAC.1